MIIALQWFALIWGVQDQHVCTAENGFTASNLFLHTRFYTGGKPSLVTHLRRAEDSSKDNGAVDRGWEGWRIKENCNSCGNTCSQFIHHTMNYARTPHSSLGMLLSLPGLDCHQLYIGSMLSDSSVYKEKLAVALSVAKHLPCSVNLCIFNRLLLDAPMCNVLKIEKEIF